MKKLEDIPRKVIFEAPEGYFDKLPGMVQSRMATSGQESSWTAYLGYSLKYALPALAVALAIFFYVGTPTRSPEELLSSVDSANLVAYLEESDLNADDLMNEVPLNLDEAEAIQKDSMNEMDVDDADVKFLSDEFGEDYF